MIHFIKLISFILPFELFKKEVLGMPKLKLKGWQFMLMHEAMMEMLLMLSNMLCIHAYWY